MLTGMSERDWDVALEVFRAARSRRGDKGRDDRKFLEAIHYDLLPKAPPLITGVRGCH